MFCEIIIEYILEPKIFTRVRWSTVDIAFGPSKMLNSKSQMGKTFFNEKEHNGSRTQERATFLKWFMPIMFVDTRNEFTYEKRYQLQRSRRISNQQIVVPLFDYHRFNKIFCHHSDDLGYTLLFILRVPIGVEVLNFYWWSSDLKSYQDGESWPKPQDQPAAS